MLLLGRGRVALAAPQPRLFLTDNQRIPYTGRVDFSSPRQPRFWAPGVYFELRFEDPACEVLLTDEVRSGTNHNYVALVPDGPRTRRKLPGPTSVLMVGGHLGPGPTTCWCARIPKLASATWS